jgi:hypothetical protein
MAHSTLTIAPSHRVFVRLGGLTRNRLLGALVLKNQSCKQSCVRKNNQRPYRSKRITDFVARMSQTDADRHDDRRGDPNPDLWDRQAMRFNVGVQPITASRSRGAGVTLACT